MTQVAQMFRKASRFPLGRRLFSWIVTRRSPYFASIAPVFHELREGHAEVVIRQRRSVENHLGSVNAIAMCAMCELAAGTMMEATLPRELRWIPKGMTVRYLKRAEGTLSATASVDPPFPPDFKGDLVVPARVRNAAGEVVMEADITMYVSPRRRPAGQHETRAEIPVSRRAA